MHTKHNLYAEDHQEHCAEAAVSEAQSCKGLLTLHDQVLISPMPILLFIDSRFTYC